MKRTKTQIEIKKDIKKANEFSSNDFGLASIEDYADFINDPVFYHPELNLIRVWAQFKVLIPEDYGWIVIGVL